MLRSLKALVNYKVSATDGEIGNVEDFYFDDDRWTVRYLVVDTKGRWSERREVLISPLAFEGADWATQHFRLSLTREKVKNSPGIDLDKPVSRQHEEDYSDYYSWPYYWGFNGLWGTWASPRALARSKDEEPRVARHGGDPHLRCVCDVVGYRIHGSDGDLGHVHDFIADDDTWAIRYLVVDTSRWWFGKSVLIGTTWIERIEWLDSKVYVSLSKQAIRKSPGWRPDQPVNREYEVRLYDYYGRPAYWVGAHRDKEGKR